MHTRQTPAAASVRAGVHEMGKMAGDSGRVGMGRLDPVCGSGEGCKARGAVVLRRCLSVAVDVLVVGGSGERGCLVLALLS